MSGRKTSSAYAMIHLSVLIFGKSTIVRQSQISCCLMDPRAVDLGRSQVGQIFHLAHAWWKVLEATHPAGGVPCEGLCTRQSDKLHDSAQIRHLLDRQSLH